MEIKIKKKADIYIYIDELKPSLISHINLQLSPVKNWMQRSLKREQTT
jgi:hypothetical protein